MAAELAWNPEPTNEKVTPDRPLGWSDGDRRDGDREQGRRHLTTGVRRDHVRSRGSARHRDRTRERAQGTRDERAARAARDGHSVKDQRCQGRRDREAGPRDRDTLRREDPGSGSPRSRA